MRKHEIFLVWFGIFLIWSLFRASFVFPEWVDELLVKPLVFVVPVLIVVHFIEKRGIGSLGLVQKPAAFLQDLYLGVAIGALFAIEGMVANYLKYGTVSFGPILAVKLTGGLGTFLVLNFFTSVWEEILGRGYLYKRMNEFSKNQFWAAVSSSFLFLLLHIPIVFTRLHLTGVALVVYPISILLLGITNSYLYSFRKSLTLPILVHTFWNLTVALFL
ncbi:CPBP family intramembrane metalloprotease [Candidatus Gottesmanbacteria bacterium]|nr:CPBP family intramembrane metalloprotease [Candidatus Gottesmanbacteria bacterium]